MDLPLLRILIVQTSENMDDDATETLRKEVQDAIESGNPVEAFEKVKKCLSDVENTPLNIAITGESGSGKSTFINAIRGMGDEEEESATTGVVETTMEPTPYCHPQHKSVKYWDLPGTGTPNFKADEYLEKVNFSQYDFFIIIAAQRFTENHIKLAKAIHDMKKKFYFVRSKIDGDIEASQSRRPKTFNEEGLLNSIRENCVQSLKEGGIEDVSDDSIFLVSSFKPEKFDFSRLLKTFEEELPAHKRHVYLRALPNISSKAIEMKKQALESIVPWIAVLVTAAAAVPRLSDSVEHLSLTLCIRQYVESFGLDNKSLNNLEERSGKSDLKKLMKSPFVMNEITNGLVLSELKKRKGTAYLIVKSIFSWIPVLSLIVAGPMSGAACAEFLYSALHEIAEDAKVALEAAVGCSDQ